MKAEIDGVDVYPMETRRDERGALTEVFRQTWAPETTAVQWNHVVSEPNVLRGVHAHLVHDDMLTVVAGTMILGLVDLRPHSPTHGVRACLELRQTESMVRIPVGVGHGFYFPDHAAILYAVTAYWDTNDELGCRWDDPDLGIDFPCTDPLLSDRDVHAGTLAELQSAVAARFVTV